MIPHRMIRLVFILTSTTLLNTCGTISLKSRPSTGISELSFVLGLWYVPPDVLAFQKSSSPTARLDERQRYHEWGKFPRFVYPSLCVFPVLLDSLLMVLIVATYLFKS